MACSALTSIDGLTGGGGDAGDGASLPTGTGDSGVAATDGDASVSSGNDDGGGSSTDTGSVTNPEPDAGVDEGGVSSDSGGTQDASAPPADSGAGVDSAVPTYCSTISPAPLFCADFDEGQALNAIWDSLTSQGGTAALTGGSNAFSAPDSMTVSLSSTAKNFDCAGYKAFLAEKGKTGTTYVLLAQVRVDEFDTGTTSDAVFLTLQFYSQSSSAITDLQFELVEASGQQAAFLSEDILQSDGGESFPEQLASQAFPLNTWVQVEISINVASSGNSPVTLSFNGTKVASTTVNLTMPSPIPQIIVGSTFANALPSAWQVRYDNVVFTAK
jgi:hypothetical protein